MDLLSVSGEQNSRVFHVESTAEVYLYTLELREGSAMSQGGAILNQGTLHLLDVRLSDSFENGVPAGLTNLGTVHIREDVTIRNQ
jgi:hypothetical protein